ncbi:hypothetical protein LTR08_001009 [Meristemomyces frigidus]|nr:hypothetical protein LTR08_001009 [Meristemomyces frigidus]
MPAARVPGTDAPPPPPPPRGTSNADNADVDAINRAVDRMRASTATDPYILTIPQDVEPRYHHAYQYQATQWLHQAPFQGKEGEMTQYQTFIYHEHGKDMYVLHNSRLRDEADGAAPKPTAGVGAGTPSGGPKRKITLEAYKRKQTPAGTPARDAIAVAKRALEVKQGGAPAKKAAVKGPVERVKEMEEAPAAPVEEDVQPTVLADEKKELKRKRQDTASQDEKTSEAPAASEEPATKKARPASPSPPPAQQPNTQVYQPEEPKRSPVRPHTPRTTSDETCLPPKLSPLMVPSLPSRLSPSIPDNMVATLKAREHLRSSSSDGSAPSLSTSKDNKLAAPNRVDGASKLKSPAPRNGFKASSSSPAVRSDAEEKARAPTSSVLQRVNTPALSREDEVAVGKALKAKKQETAPRVKTPDISQDDEVASRKVARVKQREKLSRAKTPELVQDDEAGATKGSKMRRRSQISNEQSSVPEPPHEDEIGRHRTNKRTKQDAPSMIVKMKYKKHQKEQIRRLLNMRSANDSSTPQTAATAAPALATKAVEEPKPEKPSTRRRDPNAKGVAQKVGPANSGVKKKAMKTVPGSEKRPPPAEIAARGLTAKANKLADMPVTETASAKPTAVPAEPKSTTAQPTARRKAEPEQAAETAITDISHKRKAQDDATGSGPQEPSAKRKKVPDTIETKMEPSTPVQPDLLSPVATLSSTQKSQQVTPCIRKDHLAVSMTTAREQPAGSTGNTPSAISSSTPITNDLPTSQPNGIPKPLSSQPSNKTPKQQAWEDEQKRLEALGRELKHAATAHLKSHPTTNSEQTLAAVKLLESLLAFTLAFICADEAAFAADPKQAPSIKYWRSMHGFFGLVRHHCEAFPLLMGLACQLGVIFNARILDLLLLYPSERLSKDIAMETYGALAKNAADGEMRLDVDVLAEQFPKTWKGRAKGAGGPERAGAPADFGGEYKLPIAMQVTPLRAARAGYALLEEWIGKEGVEYEMKLKL